MSKPEKSNNGFHGVYLLNSTQEKFNKIVSGTYIGYTVFPGRRILQHNRFKPGGANQTSKCGPYDMILIVHQFPNNRSALQFEWAWQNPKASVRLKRHEDFNPGKLRTETGVAYRIRCLEKMLNVGPWNKLGLIVQWLKPENKLSIAAPLHMAIACGPVEESDPVYLGEKVDPTIDNCYICHNPVSEENWVKCLDNLCLSHMTCLATKWCETESGVLPVSGKCGSCGTEQLWGMMVKARNSKHVEESEHWADMISQS